MPHTYEYPRPAVTVDVVLLAPGAEGLDVLLVRRGEEPFAGRWALPGGFLEIEEELESGARRELTEETGVEAGPLMQLGAYGRIGRDPRGRTVSVVFVGACPEGARPRAGDDAADVGLHPVDRPPPLAFDHDVVLRDARDRVRTLAARPEDLVSRLLPGPLRLADVQAWIGCARGGPVDGTALRLRLEQYGLLDGRTVRAAGRGG